jgi:thiol-disulfide isomerase/thioredoxin
MLILKFGAPWCAPCKRIAAIVSAGFEKLSEQADCYVINVDESFDLYGYLRNKKMVKTIPAVLCWKRGNNSYIPDDSVIGADFGEIEAFFDRCAGCKC